MSYPIRFCLVLHNHQPVGNFDHVFASAYEDSYAPLLDVFQSYPSLRMSLHLSGSLAEWLDEHRPEYLERLAGLVADGRIEIIGGAFYEPILTMIPSRDRIGQLVQYTRWLRRRLGAEVRGAWIAERVWEPSLVSDLASAEIQYVTLDDYHFRAAGMSTQQLTGYFVSEDEGRVLRVFPGSERLRYTIPFQPAEATIEYLREQAQRQPGSVAVFADDGEKFGTWPETKQHVYADGWLKQFFDLLVQNQDWLITSTLGEVADATAPAGKVYLPDCSYREMTRWSLPATRQLEYEAYASLAQDDPRWTQAVEWMRGGFWRNFKVKYTEANELYARMMYVSRWLQEAEQSGMASQDIQAARRHLYRAQCNCAYWHGAFGGLYLPHLRSAVYRELIQADNLLCSAAHDGRWVEATAHDYNFDDRQEVRLANGHLIAWVQPHRGGHLYELDVRACAHNLLGTMQRRAEAYHRRVTLGAGTHAGQPASIHDRVLFKQPGLENFLHYDSRPRKSLIDHFWDEQVDLPSIRSCRALERGDFADGPYAAKIRRKQHRVQLVLTREGNAWGIPLKITKGATLGAGGTEIEFAYLIEGLPQDRALHFAVEFNFAGMPTGAADRYFVQPHGQLGDLGTLLDLRECTQIGLRDCWLGLDVQMQFDKPAGLWTFPIDTVSQSEGGFELVNQSVVVQPHWQVRGDVLGRWSAKIKLCVTTSTLHQQAGAARGGEGSQRLESWVGDSSTVPNSH